MGTYPVPTDPQLLLDNDSTIWYSADGSRQNLTPILATEVQSTQDWKITTTGPSLSSTQYGGVTYWILLFPEPRNITAYSMRWTWSSSLHSIDLIRTSTDTTNGQDGTWITREDSTMLSAWRSASETAIRIPKVVNWPNIKGIEIRNTCNDSGTRTLYLQNFNIFGTLTYSGLQFWDPNLNVPLDGAGFDFGDVFQSGVYTKQFRIKNTDAMTANNVTISSPSTPENGTLYEGLSFSTDGTTFTSSVVLTTIAPGTTTAVLYVRRTVGPSDPQNTLGTARIQAVPSSWT